MIREDRNEIGAASWPPRTVLGGLQTSGHAVPDMQAGPMKRPHPTPGAGLVAPGPNRVNVEEMARAEPAQRDPNPVQEVNPEETQIGKRRKIQGSPQKLGETLPHRFTSDIIHNIAINPRDNIATTVPQLSRGIAPRYPHGQHVRSFASQPRPAFQAPHQGGAIRYAEYAPAHWDRGYGHGAPAHHAAPMQYHQERHWEPRTPPSRQFGQRQPQYDPRYFNGHHQTHDTYARRPMPDAAMTPPLDSGVQLQDRPQSPRDGRTRMSLENRPPSPGRTIYPNSSRTQVGGSPSRGRVRRAPEPVGRPSETGTAESSVPAAESPIGFFGNRAHHECDLELSMDSDGHDSWRKSSFGSVGERMEQASHVGHLKYPKIKRCLLQLPEGTLVPESKHCDLNDRSEELQLCLSLLSVRVDAEITALDSYWGTGAPGASAERTVLSSCKKIARRAMKQCVEAAVANESAREHGGHKSKIVSEEEADLEASIAKLEEELGEANAALAQWGSSEGSVVGGPDLAEELEKHIARAAPGRGLEMENVTEDLVDKVGKQLACVTDIVQRQGLDLEQLQTEATHHRDIIEHSLLQGPLKPPDGRGILSKLQW